MSRVVLAASCGLQTNEYLTLWLSLFAVVVLPIRINVPVNPICLVSTP